MTDYTEDFILQHRVCQKHTNEPTFFICLNAQLKPADLLMCRQCAQMKQKSNNLFDIRNIRSFLENNLEEKVAKLKESEASHWDDISIEQIKKTHKADLEGDIKGCLQASLKMMEEERRWVSEFIDKAERLRKSDQERKLKGQGRLEALHYVRQFDKPQVVLLKLQMSTKEELLNFRNVCLQMQKLTDEEIRRGNDEATQEEQISQRFGDRLAMQATAQLKQFLRSEATKKKILTERVNLHRQSDSSSKRSNSQHSKDSRTPGRKRIFSKLPTDRS